MTVLGKEPESYIITKTQTTGLQDPLGLYLPTAIAIDLSLTRLLQLLPHLPYTRPTLHIAGTNGKGSVSALLTSILLATPTSPSHPAPLHIGQFNSLHLLSVLDSITLSNVPVSQATYDKARNEVLDADRAQGTKLTNFEVLTMAALRVFENEKVDIVVLEVGMGGRLDATNVIPDDSVLVSALTAVDLDHQMFLGATVGLIAKEKAGIARKGRPFVLGRQKHEEVKEVVKATVESVGGTLVPALEVKPGEGAVRWSILELDPDGADVTPPPQPVVVTLNSFPDTPLHASLPLHGAHQLDNLGTALGVIDSLLSSTVPLATSLNLKGRISLDSIAQGIAATRWPGRLSFHTLSFPLQDGQQKKLVVLADGAHNPASAETLGAYITHLLSLSQSSTASSTPSSLTTTVPITYILALSHSPPKTSLQTLSPILPPTLTRSASTSTSTSDLNVKTSVALLRFTPPDGMPWIKSVPPASSRRRTVADPQLLRRRRDIWAAPERTPFWSALVERISL
ncbi:Mur ligase [Gymnopilus junonius]|uniref:Mur ligase n=1 Tax=Gymnopilus junonius TaxID=109634 RepID=A0A9P5TLC1_GYMJU|nr:Mur ligase [Gymnopilus junonius]